MGVVDVICLQGLLCVQLNMQHCGVMQEPVLAAAEEKGGRPSIVMLRFGQE